ncbi:MAG: sugar transferase [Flammeovirgaceae bacterium]|nr:sugar transferase [Flammeovirgaceae bacterium]
MQQRFTRYSKYIRYIQTFIDVFLLNFSFILAYNYKFDGGLIWNIENDYFRLLVFFNIVWVLLLIICKPYNISRIASSIISGVYGSSITLVVLHSLVIVSSWVVFKTYYFSREHLFVTYGIFLGFLLVWKVLFVYSLKYYRLKGYNKRNILILGGGQLGDELTMFFRRHPDLGYRVHKLSYGLMGKDLELDLIRDFSEKNEIHEVYCCLPQLEHSLVQQVIDYGESSFLKIKLISDFRGFMDKGIDLEYLDYIPVLNINKSPLEDYKIRFVKRSFDIMFSLMVLIVGFPIYLLVGVITVLTSDGPMFYKQERIGKWGLPFMIFKYRSMYVDSEIQGPKLSSDFDPRITPWGRFIRKTRLDEIPQFYNVLIGDMSIVGPRPERQHFIDQIIRIAPHYKKLHAVKPGITSIGQIMYGYAENVEEMVKRLRYDILYLNNISIGFDMKLVLLTVKVIFQAKGK